MVSIKKDPIFIIIPVHNRKNVTLSCLQKLSDSGDLQRFNTVVIDDGSTDGTSEAIQKNYPSVTIIFGDGNFWWTGAIRKGMEFAFEQGAEYFVWLNDDTLPEKQAISLLVEACRQHSKSIFSGQCYSSQEPQKTTFGGQIRNKMSLTLLSAAPNQVLECDCLSGNLVCLPRSIIEDIGYPPNQSVPHNTGDVVYTYTAKKAGYNLQVLGSAIAVCDFNPEDDGWLTSDVPIIYRWRILSSPKSYLYFPGLWHYCLTMYGFWGTLIVLQAYVQLCVISVLRFLFPLSWLRQIKELKSHILST